MRLVTGGFAQGKLEYVLLKYGLSEEAVRGGIIPEQLIGREETVVINGFHGWVRERMEQGGCPEDEVFAFLEQCDNCIIISDEIGNGIVPTEPFER